MADSQAFHRLLQDRFTAWGRPETQGRGESTASVWSSGRSVLDWQVRPGQDSPRPSPRGFMPTLPMSGVLEGWGHPEGRARNLYLCPVLLQTCRVT